MTSYERTGWRDESLSRRHREWGFNCPAVDLDFLVVEYNVGKPVAVVEYKHFKAQTPNIKHPTYRALDELCRLSSLPFLIVFYCPDDWWFRVYPVNAIARTHYLNGQYMSEYEYVHSLYKLRGLVVEQAVVNKLSRHKPAEAA